VKVKMENICFRIKIICIDFLHIDMKKLGKLFSYERKYAGKESGAKVDWEGDFLICFNIV
jgi:hypothetical protein